MASTAVPSGKMTPPIETKTNMDSDYDYYAAKQQAFQSNPPPPPPRSDPPAKGGFASAAVAVTPEKSLLGPDPNDSPDEEDGAGGDEALLDLAQLEELHAEAERMKALGNKHMAAQVGYVSKLADQMIESEYRFGS